MPFAVGQKIMAADIVNYAYTQLTNSICANCYTSGTIPTSPMGIKVVPVQYLASSTSFAQPYVGGTNNRIDGKRDANNDTRYYNKNITTMAIYNAIVHLTRQLLSVGTFSYHEHKVYTNANDPTPHTDRNVYNLSGKCIFNLSTVYSVFGGGINRPQDIPFSSTLNGRTDDPPADANVVIGNKITLQSIINLCNNCINKWQNSAKVRCEYTHSLCHDNCHSSCHSSCNCNCHDFANCNFNNHYAAEHDPNYSCETCQCYDNSPWFYGDLPDMNLNHSCDGCNCDGGYSCHSNTVDSIRLFTYIGS